MIEIAVDANISFMNTNPIDDKLLSLIAIPIISIAVIINMIKFLNHLLVIILGGVFFNDTPSSHLPKKLPLGQ